MAFTPKAPSAKNRSVSITVPKEKDPYLVEWFQETKNEGESVNDFIIRQLMVLVHNHNFNKEQRILSDSSNENLLNGVKDLAEGIGFLNE